MTGPDPDRDSTAGEQCYSSMASTAPARRTPPPTPRGDCECSDNGDPPSSQQEQPHPHHHHQYHQHDEADSTPRSEVPSDAATAAAAAADDDDEPSYFSPQPRRAYAYSSAITRSTPASSEPSPVSSASASTASLNNVADAPLGEGFGPSLHPLNRPAYERDLSSISTASNATVRGNPVARLHHFQSEPAVPQHRDGPVYPNQSYAALQFQQYPTPYAPPIQRARSSHPAHFSASSVSAIPPLVLPISTTAISWTLPPAPLATPLSAALVSSTPPNASRLARVSLLTVSTPAPGFIILTDKPPRRATLQT